MNTNITLSRLIQKSNDSKEYHKYALGRLINLKGEISEVEYEAISICEQIGWALASMEIDIYSGDQLVDKNNLISLALLRESLLLQKRAVAVLSDKSDPREKLERIARALKGEVIALLKEANDLAAKDYISTAINAANEGEFQ